MNIFNLAFMQLDREGRSQDKKNYLLLFIDRAIRIRKYLDEQEEKRQINLFKKIS